IGCDPAHIGDMKSVTTSLASVSKQARPYTAPRTAALCLEPASHIQPGEYQSRSYGHEADAHTLPSLPHTVERQGDPHHGKARQSQDVHAEEDVLGEHYPPRSNVIGSCLAPR